MYRKRYELPRVLGYFDTYYFSLLLLDLSCDILHGCATRSREHSTGDAECDSETGHTTKKVMDYGNANFAYLTLPSFITCELLKNSLYASTLIACGPMRAACSIE